MVQDGVPPRLTALATMSMAKDSMASVQTPVPLQLSHLRVYRLSASETRLPAKMLSLLEVLTGDQVNE